MPENQPAFVPAYDKASGRKVGDVPPHFLGDGSPFPNLTATPQAAARGKAVEMPQDDPRIALADPITPVSGTPDSGEPVQHDPEPDSGPDTQHDDAAADSGADTHEEN